MTDPPVADPSPWASRCEERTKRSLALRRRRSHAGVMDATAKLPAILDLPVFRAAYADRTAALMAALAAYAYQPGPGEDPVEHKALNATLPSPPPPPPPAPT